MGQCTVKVVIWYNQTVLNSKTAWLNIIIIQMMT